MTRQTWRDFICAPERAGRHLSSIGRGVSGTVSDAIDLAVLQAFLEKLKGSTDDTRLLASTVDLLVGGYAAYSKGGLHRILDMLSNEMLSKEQIVGPGLRGNPRWDRTMLLRMAGTLSPVHYVSRTSHRSFELPENRLLAWLVADLSQTTAAIEKRVGTTALHPDLYALRESCERARRHHWFGDVGVPLRLSPEMTAAAARHRRPEYREAARLAQRRAEMETSDRASWWYAILSLLAVNWLEPISDDDLFELYVLILTLDILSDELGFGEPEEYGLVTSRRGHIALFVHENQRIKVYFDQTPTSALRAAAEGEYGKVVARHRGISGHERRPDILIVTERGGEKHVVFVEMKKSADGRYIADSIYKVFGYLYDFRRLPGVTGTPRAVLVVPSGVSAAPGMKIEGSILVASGDDRSGVAAALKEALPP